MADASRKYATWMTVGAMVLVLLLLTLLFDKELTQQINPNQQVQTNTLGAAREVSLARNRAGHFVVTGSINGVNVTFMVDTGATTVAVPESVARKAGLIRGMEITAITASGLATAYTTQIDHLAIGGISEQNVEASINPEMPGNEVLLGMSFLSRLEFTQRGDTLTLRQGGQ